MNMRWVIVLAISTALPAPASAQHVMGGGTATCSQLIEADAFYVNHANMQWLVGFLSGIATTTQAINDASGNPNASVLPARFIDHAPEDYVKAAKARCEADGSRTLARVGDRIVNSLMNGTF